MVCSIVVMLVDKYKCDGIGKVLTFLGFLGCEKSHDLKSYIPPAQVRLKKGITFCIAGANWSEFHLSHQFPEKANFKIRTRSFCFVKFAFIVIMPLY